ncbi:hypothetical protein N9Q05_00330 [bacterium]|nr:hypothetical protein [bacterium]
MSFTNNLTKAQFKLDHTSLQNRALILCALVLVIMIPWFFLIYTPQLQQAVEAQDQINELQEKTDSIRAKYESILNFSKNANTAKMIAKYDLVKKDIKTLNQEITHYHHTYITDEELSRLLHSILEDIKTVTIEDFSTKVVPPPIATVTPSQKTVTPAVAATPTSPAVPAVPVQPRLPKFGAKPSQNIPPEMTRYTLSLKGDYFSILRFLQRIERLKWQLFWESLTYHVETYPEGIATIEFYTLKPGHVVVAPPAPPATKGAAK